MARPTLLVTSRQLLSLADPPQAEFEVLCVDGSAGLDAVIQERGSDVRAVLTAGIDRFDAARFDLLPALEIVAVTAAGYSGIDLEAARVRGIAVTNAGSRNAADVADYAVALTLAHVREVIVNDRYVREDRWPAGRRPPGRSVSHERVGIVGLGHIGQAVAERLAPFGCVIGWWGPRPKPDRRWGRFETLHDLAAWASVLIVAARGDASTRGFIDAEVLRALGPQGLIINVSRGFVIDEPALIAALCKGELGGAALDVFDGEPIAGSRYGDVPHLIMSPHVAGATAAALAEVAAAALDNVRHCLAGRPLQNRLA